MKKLRILPLLLCAALLAAFAGCSGGKKKDELKKVTNVYRQTQYALPEGMSNVDKLLYSADSGTVTVVGGKYDENWNMTPMLCKLDLSSGETTMIPLDISAQGNAYVQQSAVSPDGTIWLVYVAYTYDETTGAASSDAKFLHLDAAGKLIKSVPASDVVEGVTDDYGNTYYNIGMLRVTPEGKLLVVSENTVYTVNKDGVPEGKVVIDGVTYMDCLILEENGGCIIGYSDDSGTQMLKKFDLTTGKPDESVVFSDAVKNRSSAIFAGPENSLYYSDGTGVYAYDKATASSTELLNWINSDISTDSLMIYNGGMIAVSADRFIALSNAGGMTIGGRGDGAGSSSVFVFDRVPDDEIKAKHILTLGCLETPYDLKDSIIAFNRSSDEYRITIKTYYDGSVYTEDGYDNAVTALNNDIISGKMPDILLINSEMPFDSYVAKGLFVDMNKYIDGENGLDRSLYYDNVLRAMEIDGHLYDIAPSFAISTFAAKTKFVGGMNGWTMADLKSVLDKNSGMIAFSGDFTQKSILETGITFALENYIDKNTGRCSFDSEGFVGLLEYAKSMSAKSIWEQMEEKGEYDDDFWEDYDHQWSADRVLISPLYMSSFSDYWMRRQSTFGDDITLIGFPNDNKVTAAIIPYNDIAISSRSACPEGAWAFVSYLLSDELQSTVSYNWPLLRSRVDGLAQEAKESGNVIYYGDANGSIGTIVPGEKPDVITDEAIAAVKEVIASVSVTVRTDKQVMEIVSEEAAAFFAGQKTATETAAVIQNRVQTYVSESR